MHNHVYNVYIYIYTIIYIYRYVVYCNAMLCYVMQCNLFMYVIMYVTMYVCVLNNKLILAKFYEIYLDIVRCIENH